MKKGDKVKCLEGYEGRLILNKFYTINYIPTSLKRAVCVIGCEMAFAEERFELASGANTLEIF